MTENMLFFLAFDLVLFFAALSDARTLRISNIFPVALVILFLAWTFWSGNWADLWRHGLAFVIALSAGLLLFSLSFLGGGDAKLFAAAALWFIPGQLPAMTFFVTIAGALLAILIFLSKLFFSKSSTDTKWAMFSKKPVVPYGVAVAIGSILSLHFVNQV
jgi:prepilin peptidase CpaA